MKVVGEGTYAELERGEVDHLRGEKRSGDRCQGEQRIGLKRTG